MNVEATQSITGSNPSGKTSQSSQTNKSDIKFADELKNLDKNSQKTTEKNKKNETTKESQKNDKKSKNDKVNKTDNAVKAVDGLTSTIKELNELNRSDEDYEETLKVFDNNDDINHMLDKDFTIREKEILNPQMSSSMGFNSNGQPFSDFMNNNKDELASNENEIAEERSVLSTMTENYLMAKANSKASEIKSQKNSEQLGESIDTVIMTRNDVDFFTAIVNKNELNINEITDIQKSSHVSKTLADMLADSMKNNKPLRIDFDNDISVIIKISRDGKISADFLPSSQIAEAYLKENLPLLKQRFDENNIDYNELNQRKQQRQEQDKDNRKKGSKDE